MSREVQVRFCESRAVRSRPATHPVVHCVTERQAREVCEREVLAALLDHEHHLIRDGQIMLADKGFAGQAFAAHTATLGLRLLRPDRKDETFRNGNLGDIRQWIESVNHTLKGQLGLERHGGRTLPGLGTRIAQRLLAMAAGIWHNSTAGITAKRSLTAYDH